MDKAKLRSYFIKKRQNLSRQEVKEKSAAIFKKVKKLIYCTQYKKFLLYSSISNEVLTDEAVEFLAGKNREVFLPAFGSGFYRISKFEGWEEMIEGPYYIRQPKKGRFIKSQDIEVAIIPGVAFSKSGVRLGYGKGVYDRLLAKSNAIKIGLAYEFQIASQLPQEEHDLLMDIVVTEKKVYRF